MKILIVEDDKVVADTLIEGLQLVCEKEGCDLGIEVAYDAIGVAELHHEKRFDLIIIDLLLPSENGMEVIKKIRESDNVVEFVIITGQPSLDTAIEAIRQKVFAYMLKPFTLSELIFAAQNAVAYSILKKKMLSLAEQATLTLKRKANG